MQIAIAIVLIVLLLVLVMGGIMDRSEPGYEDEDGFHKGPAPKPCDHSARKILGHDAQGKTISECRTCGEIFEQ